jgi:hypothetical protein
MKQYHNLVRYLEQPCHLPIYPAGTGLYYRCPLARHWIRLIIVRRDDRS